MKAFIVDRYGKKGGARLGEMPEPELRQNDVLVQIHATSVNLLDSKIRSGEFKLFCLIAYRSFWATMWRESSFGSDRRCRVSSQAMRSMRDPIKIESARSRNSSR